MYGYIVFFLTYFTCLMTVLHAQEEKVEDFFSIPSIHALEQQYFDTFIEGNNRFAFDFYQAVKFQAGNFAYSSYSIVSGLALVAPGAKGKTEQLLRKAFGYPVILLPFFRDVKELLQTPLNNQNMSSHVFLANALWLQKDIPLLSSYIQSLARNFSEKLHLVDFMKESSASVRLINQWTSEQTNRKINTVLNPSEVNTTTQMIITTASSLMGHWAEPFEKEKTKRESFQLSDRKSIMADMMHASHEYSYWKGELCEILVLPYQAVNQEAQLEMVILLPSGKNLGALEKEFTWKNWKNWLQGPQLQSVAVTFPRFRIDKHWDLNNPLRSLGLSSLFSSEADFSGITEQKGFFINKAIHKCSLRVDESGNEATGIVTKNNTQKQKEVESAVATFTANHPFIFVIREKKTGLIVYVGRVTLP